MPFLAKLFKKPGSIKPDKARELIEQGAIVIDVRDRREYQAGHIPVAKHIPLSQIQAYAPKLDPEHTYLVVCRSGSRSVQAAKWLTDQGLIAFNLAGGLAGWERANLPLVGSSGRRARVV